MELESKSRVVNAIEEAAFLFRQPFDRRSLSSHQMKPAQSNHDRDESPRLTDLLAERPCLLKVLSQLLRGDTMYDKLRRHQQQAEREFLPRALWRGWEMRQQCEPFLAVHN